jgi:hypothetical protein
MTPSKCSSALSDSANNFFKSELVTPILVVISLGKCRLLSKVAKEFGVLEKYNWSFSISALRHDKVGICITYFLKPQIEGKSPLTRFKCFHEDDIALARKFLLEPFAIVKSERMGVLYFDDEKMTGEQLCNTVAKWEMSLIQNS